MPRGSRIAETTRLKFRSKLLELGFVSGAARAAGIPVSSGMAIAKKFEADPKFVKEREALRARVLPELEARLLRLGEVIEKRVTLKDPTPDELAKIATRHKLKSFSYQNPKPQYFRGLVDMFGKIAASRRTGDVTVPGDMGDREVTIRISPVAKPHGEPAGG